jgi:hypothetical protein
MYVTKTEVVWHTAYHYYKKMIQYKMFLLLFLFCSYNRNWIFLILFNTHDYHNFGTRKCAQNIYFVKEMEEENCSEDEQQIFTLGTLFTS